MARVKTCATPASRTPKCARVTAPVMPCQTALRCDRAERLGRASAQNLLSLLRDGGRLGAIVGSDPVMRFTVIQRKGDRFETTSPGTPSPPRLVNFPEPSSFSF